MSFTANTKNRKPVKIGILEISIPNRSMLEFFFSDAGKSYFKEESPDNASAYIIDYDSPGAKDSWESIYNETNKPGIILSIKEVDLPSTVWLKKPLTIKALIEAGELIQEMVKEQEPSEPSETEVAIKPVANDVEIAEDHSETPIKLSEEIAPKELNTKKVPKLDDLLSDDISDLSLDEIIKEVSEENQIEEIEDSIDVSGPAVPEKEIEKELKLETEENINETKEDANQNLEIEDVKDVNVEFETNEETELSLVEAEDNTPSIDIETATNLELEASDLSNNEAEVASTSASADEVNYTDADKEIDTLLESLISGEGSNKNSNDAESEIENIDTNFDEVEIIDIENSLTETADESTSTNGTKTTNEENVIDSSEAVTDENKNTENRTTAEEELQAILDEIRFEADGATAGTGKVRGFTDADRRWKLLCGEDEDIKLEKIEKFNPSKHFLACLVKNIQDSMQNKTVLRMKVNGMIIVINPESDLIYCEQSISSKQYSDFCYEPMVSNKIKVHKLDESETRLYNKKMDENVEYTHLTESFVWTTSLLTSRGRIPKGTNLKEALGLTTWPNLTRVESFPNMMQIAALFNKGTWSLLEITKKSDIPKNHVVAFYNAALALNIIESNGKSKASAKPNFNNGNKKKSGSFFSRILSKLTT